jgi:hypothetical protein
LIAVSLATFSIVWLLVFENGPWNVVDDFRNWLRAKFDNVGKAVDCPVCASIWISVPIVLVYLLDARLLYPFVAIAVCIILFGVIDGGSE